MDQVVRVLCGSHLYGTALPDSDKDYKSVFIPPAREIILGRGNKITNHTTLAEDEEKISLQAFLKLVCEGQTNALDMLFAPPEFWPGTDFLPEWTTILSARSRLISKQCKSFVGYCRQQAGKYSVKVERMLAIEELVDYLEIAHESGLVRTLGDLPELAQFAVSNPFASIEPIRNAQGREIPHLSVCETMIPLTAPLQVALHTYKEKYNKYGERARRAKSMDAKDWKALYHAVRVAKEALELLETHTITLPRPERRYLLSIRKGEVPYEEISDLLEEHLLMLEEAQIKSTLPEEPDYALAEEFVVWSYSRQIGKANSVTPPVPVAHKRLHPLQPL